MAILSVENGPIVVSTSGVEGNMHSNYASVSGDGRYVAFLSATNTILVGDVFVKDLVTGAIRLASANSYGQQQNGACYYSPALSADGRYVAFTSDASNLVAGDSNGNKDVFVKDLLTGTIQRASTAVDGSQGNGSSYAPAISANGRYVAFISTARNLSTNDANNNPDILVKDLVTGDIRVASSGPNGVAGFGWLGSDNGQAWAPGAAPFISPDGRYVAFASDATDLVLKDTSGPAKYDFFVKDMVTGSIRLVSVADDGSQGNLMSLGAVSMSADSRYVAFSSYANTLVPGDTNGCWDVFVKDLDTGGVQRIASGDGGPMSLAISPDGRYVAFSSGARNLVAGDSNGIYDLFVSDLITGDIERISMGDGSTGQATTPAHCPVFSADSRIITFTGPGELAGGGGQQILQIANPLVPHNMPPEVAVPLADQVATEGQPCSITVPAGTFADPNAGDSLRYRATLADGSALPAWLVFDATLGTFSGTPSNADVGLVNVVVTATDPDGASASDAFDLSVVNVNDRPLITLPLGNQSAVEDVPFSFAVPAGSFTDIDVGDTLSYGATLANGDALPNWLTFDAATQTFSGTPANGDVGNVSIKVTATDLAGASASQTFAVAVANANDAPVVTADEAFATEDAAAPVTGNVLANDADIDAGTVLAVSNAGTYQGAYGTLILGADGAYAYAPDNASAAVQTLAAGQSVTDTFAYTASDGEAGVDSSLTIHIAGANDAPVAGTALTNQTVNANSAFSYALPTDAFTDVDAGDQLAYGATLSDGNALPGWLSFDAATGAFSGTPASAGSWQIEVTATDASGASAAQSFALTVQQAGNAAPVTVGDTASVKEDTTLFATGNVLANDHDPEGAVLKVGNPGIRSGDYGTLLMLSNGGYTYLLNDCLPSVQALGEGEGVVDRFTYQASDGKTGTAGELVVTVHGKNDAPILAHCLKDQKFKRNANVSWQLPANSFTDIDRNDTLSYSAKLSNGNALPSWLKFDAATRSFTGKVPANAKGSIEIEVTASDGHGAKSVAMDKFKVSFDDKGGCDDGHHGGGGNPPSSGHGGHSDHGHGDSHDNHHHDHDAPKPHHDKAPWDFEKGKHLVTVDPKQLDHHFAQFDGGKRDFDSASYMARWIEHDLAVSRWVAEQDKCLPELNHGRHGADIGTLHGAANGFLGSKHAFGVDAVSLMAGAGTQLKSFKGLHEGMQRIG